MKKYDKQEIKALKTVTEKNKETQAGKSDPNRINNAIKCRKKFKEKKIEQKTYIYKFKKTQLN